MMKRGICVPPLPYFPKISVPIRQVLVIEIATRGVSFRKPF